MKRLLLPDNEYQRTCKFPFAIEAVPEESLRHGKAEGWTSEEIFGNCCTESEELAIRKSNMKMLNPCAAKVKQGDGLSFRKDEESI